MFQTLLDRFVAAVGRHDSAGLAALFTEDGIYDDYFFGSHQGRSEIAAMLDRFHVGGEQFVWEFLEPVCDGSTGYARYCFSYLSREPESAGQPVVFEGMSRFQLRDGLIARYSEVFDRAVAFTQLGYAPERIVKLMGRYARGFRDEQAIKDHLAQRDQRAAAWRIGAGLVRTLTLTIPLALALQTTLVADAAAQGESAASPVGLWRTVDDASGQAKALVRISEREGALMGRIERLLVDPPESLCQACPGDLKGKPVVGLTILQGLRRDGEAWSGGQILDPKDGKSYKVQARLTDSGEKLQVRGYVGVPTLGRTQTWQRER